MLLIQFSDVEFKKEYSEKVDVNFQSVKNIVLHITNSGYVYANHIRKKFENNYVVPEIEIEETEQTIIKLDEMLEYTVETFEDKWKLTDDDLLSTIIKTSWTTYDFEAIIEHAIVHVLRHRLQIEKMIIKKEMYNDTNPKS